MLLFLESELEQRVLITKLLSAIYPSSKFPEHSDILS